MGFMNVAGSFTSCYVATGKLMKPIYIVSNSNVLVEETYFVCIGRFIF